MNFLIADVIKFSSDTKITLSQRGATKIKSKLDYKHNRNIGKTLANKFAIIP